MQSGSGSEMSLKAACCACLSELVVNDANGQQTVQNNGIYLLAMLLVQPMSRSHHLTATAAAAATDTPDAVTVHLQVHTASSDSDSDSDLLNIVARLLKINNTNSENNTTQQY